MTVLIWIGVAAFGGIGALARFRLDEVVQLRTAGDFPLGTLLVNLSGSFTLGVLAGAGIGGDALLLVGTGLLGAFTTFSTWMLETQRLGEEGEGRLALLNLGISLAAGFALAALGFAIGRMP